MDDLVSIIIPAYNAELTLARAIDSVLAQTYSAVELLVVNDGSSDGTRQICEEYGEKIRYIEQENKGVSAARNHGIREAKGEYIGFLDSDDWYLPAKLQEMIPLFEKYPEVGAVTCAFYEKEDHGDKRFPLLGQVFPEEKIDGVISLIKELSFQHRVVHTNTILIRKQVFNSVGAFDEQFHFGEDLELWIRIGGNNSVAFMDKALCVYNRISESSVCNQAPSHLHGLDFLYLNEQMKDKIEQKYFNDFMAWRTSQLLVRYHGALILKEKNFVEECAARLHETPMNELPVSLKIMKFPKILWPLVTKLYLKLSRYNDLFLNVVLKRKI
jgi:glycosyltransferase involved in cell wall biosynthesis